MYFKYVYTIEVIATHKLLLCVSGKILTFAFFYDSSSSIISPSLSSLLFYLNSSVFLPHLQRDKWRDFVLASLRKNFVVILLNWVRKFLSVVFFLSLVWSLISEIKEQKEETRPFGSSSTNHLASTRSICNSTKYLTSS